MIVRDFLAGFVRIRVLRHAEKGPVYGLALLGDLRRDGYALGPGTLYPLLHDLEEAGYLARERRVVGGRVRKYYLLTPSGARALRGARAKVRGLLEEVLERPARLHGMPAAAPARRSPPVRPAALRRQSR